MQTMESLVWSHSFTGILLPSPHPTVHVSSFFLISPPGRTHDDPFVLFLVVADLNALWPLEGVNRPTPA